ncbi:hypothetical protein EDC04DRAFT_2907339 [Pisolithus marmoratus]|nr:hypothetical protein EDC04DRAFT_2907339 [Pisolithus marmoratus]
MTSRFGISSQTISQLISIRSIEILSKFWQQRVQKTGGKVSITLGVLSVTFGVVLRTKQVTSIEEIVPALRPTTKEPTRVIPQVPRFRLLIVGKAGVGKSTLLNRVFGVETVHVAQDRPGEADIEKEFTSPHDDRFIFHDSRGFEPGDSGNYETVMSFIKRRRMPDIKDQLHAVWLCFQIPIPTHGERLLEDAAEAFLAIGKDVLGNIPTIIVFTKYDRLVTFMQQKMPGDLEVGQRYLQEYCIQPIQDFTGDRDILHVALLRAKPKYEQSLQDLISLTQEQVSKSFTSRENQVVPVLLTRAHFSKLKVDLSIDVGKQRYWRALGASANIRGYTMKDCLYVIHAGIVSELFYDELTSWQYLYCEEFRNLMMNTVEKVDAPPESNAELSRSETIPESPIPRILLAPVILPIKALITPGKWVYETYQRLQSFPTKFMAYIVDLTHVLEILFSLTAAMREKKLTRTAIKLAYKAYYGSEWMAHTHTDIKSFECRSTDRAAVLEKITSMISSGDRVVRVPRALEMMPSVDLERDEEWLDQEVSQ